MRTLDGQTWCSVCGASFGDPQHSRIFVIDGERVRVVYPERIEYHDIIPRSRGGDPTDLANQVPLCRGCHTQHHSVSPFTFTATTYSRSGVSGVLRRLPCP